MSWRTRLLEVPGGGQELGRQALRRWPAREASRAEFSSLEEDSFSGASRAADRTEPAANGAGRDHVLIIVLHAGVLRPGLTPPPAPLPQFETRAREEEEDAPPATTTTRITRRMKIDAGSMRRTYPRGKLANVLSGTPAGR